MGHNPVLLTKVRNISLVWSTTSMSGNPDPDRGNMAQMIAVA